MSALRTPEGVDLGARLAHEPRTSERPAFQRPRNPPRIATAALAGIFNEALLKTCCAAMGAVELAIHGGEFR
jgi:hypothetical protein